MLEVILYLSDDINKNISCISFINMKLLLLILMRIGFCLDCKDDAGRSVDFWLILKLPKNDEKKLSGWEYLYCDSND